MFFRTGLIIFLTWVILNSLSCSSVSVKNYETEKPSLVMEDYFNGTFTAHGIFLNRSGEIKKRFVCKIKASWLNGVGTLEENFTYSDGTTSQRIWKLKKASEGVYEGTAGDVIGTAIGKVAGNALHWEYVLDLEVDGTNYKVNFDDWMYLMDKKVMLNKSVMTKFGFKLGEVILTFYKD